MSKLISAILDQPEPSVKKLISKLEAKNGYPSHDVRHLAENIQKTRQKITELGLDPDDTTSQELYHTLISKFSSDSQKFDQRFSLVNTTQDQAAELAVRLVFHNFEMPQQWFIKASAAKKLLKNHQPKKLLRHLNYRSLDSLLKRENLAEIYLAISHVESVAWTKDHNKLISKLDSNDFELRKLSMCHLNRAKWGQLGSEDVLAHNSEYGVLGLLPDQQNVSTLSLVILLLDGLSGFKQLKTATSVAKLSPELDWWSDMEGLVANLAGDHVSMSLSDVSLNSSQTHSFQNRLSDAGKSGFWHNLLSRYENQLIPQEDLNINFSDLFNFKVPLNQPAFEYVEDI